jgi:hypothetical protein
LTARTASPRQVTRTEGGASFLTIERVCRPGHRRRWVDCMVSKFVRHAWTPDHSRHLGSLPAQAARLGTVWGSKLWPRHRALRSTTCSQVIERLTDLDECWYEMKSVRYAWDAWRKCQPRNLGTIYRPPIELPPLSIHVRPTPKTPLVPPRAHGLLTLWAQENEAGGGKVQKHVTAILAVGQGSTQITAPHSAVRLCVCSSLRRPRPCTQLGSRQRAVPTAA